LAAPVVEDLKRVEAFLAILGNTYMNYLPDLKMRRNEFEVIGRVLAEVPVRRVRTASDSSMLFDLCKTIAADAGALLASTAL
jgi:hypothetical protein